MEQKAVFSLDVGTRKVTGLLVEQISGVFTVKAVETMEHETRAMLDGQIHDIPKVAEIITCIRKKLEEKCACKLSSAAVAAAGRSLSTTRGQAEIYCKPSKRLSREDVLGLEYAAVYQAQQELLSRQQGKACFSDQYHCVGYSVIRYTLDGSPLGNLEEQRGGTAACEIIATFLPRVVVDSLRSVLEMSELQLESLTLEPIAALKMVVPPGMRRLNLALVDIGAGTSDIAITRDGTVFAYDMVPVAGDEITESLCEHFLLDFMEAEKLKRKLARVSTVSFANVLGDKVTMETKEILSVITPALADLARRIARAILKNNETPPQAVFCVGGGSLMPGLTQALAEQLSLGASRVTIKGKDIVNLLPEKAKHYKGPELVTPLGIAYTSPGREALHFYRVSVNGQNIDVLDLGKSSVADALLAAGVSGRELVAPAGRGLSVEVNGQVVLFAGEMGGMAIIKVNGLPSTLETKLSQGDAVICEPTSPGADAGASVALLLDNISPYRVRLNGREYSLAPPVYRGEQLLDQSQQLYDRDKLRIVKKMPLSWVLQQLDLAGELSGGAISISVNGEERQVPYGPKVIRINGSAAVSQSEVSDGDYLEITDDGVYPTVGDVTEARGRKVEFLVNDEVKHFPVKEVIFKINGLEAAPEAPLHNGDRVEIKETDYEVTLADVLNLIDFQTKPPMLKNRLVLRVNGREAQFTTTITTGDRLEVGWSA